MAFRCPQCLGTKSLGIVMALQLPSDSMSDEIALQVIECSSCQFRGLAVYEESRRGSLETDSWEHTGYRTDSEAVDQIAAAIRQCPNPDNHRCDCASHCRFRAADVRHRWNGLDGLNLQGTFRMTLSLA